MKASELIARLHQAIADHGDLPVSVEDGLDPSDLQVAEVVELVYEREAFLGYRDMVSPTLQIR